MNQNSEKDMQNRIVRLERQVRFSWVGAVVFITMVIACMNSGSALSTSEDTVLRVRGLVVVDDQGNDRILLGAPVPFGGSRVRQDTTNGLLIMDANGIDRVVVGSPNPNPQIRGRVAKRISPGTGINFNDKNGNERQRIFIGNNAVDGTAGFYMDDTTGTRRLFMSLDQLGSPLLKMVDEDGNSVVELPKK